MPLELQWEMVSLVEQTKHRSRWSASKTLAVLEIPRSTYQRWLQTTPRPTAAPRSTPGNLYELLPTERQAVIDYALAHPEVRHRELAWKMLDAEVCAVSSSSVYRVLREANLVCRWKPKPKPQGTGREARPTGPDQKWQTDIKYVRGPQGNYYLLSFMDVYSRYIVHHALLRWMDGQTVSIEAAAALEKLNGSGRPEIQSDHGSGLISREFAETLSEFGVMHKKIRPHTPTDNAEIERYHRTIDERLNELEAADFATTAASVDRIIDHYNHERLHSALSFLRPVDWYRGNPTTWLAERRRKLETAKTLRKQENLKLRQSMLPWSEATVA
ncbi:MAG: DDE-type integrase/transposase/recombinase [Phycisphaerales bacterium]